MFVVRNSQKLTDEPTRVCMFGLSKANVGRRKAIETLAIHGGNEVREEYKGSIRRSAAAGVNEGVAAN